MEAFDHIAVVNLAHRRDRLREIRGQLERIGLNFGQAEVAIQPACQYADAAGFPTTGTRGCFESHLAVWRQALAANRRATLLFEDDLDFAPNAGDLVPTAMKALASTDWAIFYGGTLAYDGKLTAPMALADPRRSVMGGHFIALRREAIERLVPYLEAILRRPGGHPDGGPMHVDGAYSRFRADNPDLQTWIASPVLGHQRPSRTDIHALRLFDRLPLVRTAAASARQLKRRFG